jgi:hypothetical protein
MARARDDDEAGINRSNKSHDLINQTVGTACCAQVHLRIFSLGKKPLLIRNKQLPSKSMERAVRKLSRILGTYIAHDKIASHDKNKEYER